MLTLRFLLILASVSLLSCTSVQAAPKPAPDLKIEDLSLSDSDGGLKVQSDRKFSGGEKLYLDFKIGGFAEAGEIPRAHLSYKLSAVDEQNRLLAPSKEDIVDVEITPEDKHWRPPVRYEIEIPPMPRSGVHRFLIRVKDDVAGSMRELEVPFVVTSTFPDPPEKLSLYALQLLRSDTDATPLSESDSYKPGGKLIASFYITGFRPSQTNGYRVEYGLQIRDAARKAMFSIPKAAEEQKANLFYPVGYVAGGISVDLDKRLSSGTYTLVLSIHDIIGDQHTEFEQSFKVAQ